MFGFYYSLQVHYYVPLFNRPSPHTHGLKTKLSTPGIVCDRESWVHPGSSSSLLSLPPRLPGYRQGKRIRRSNPEPQVLPSGLEMMMNIPGEYPDHEDLGSSKWSSHIQWWRKNKICNLEHLSSNRQSQVLLCSSSLPGKITCPVPR